MTVKPTMLNRSTFWAVAVVTFSVFSSSIVQAHPKWMTGCTLMLPVERNKCQKMPVTHKHPGMDTTCYTLETPIYGKPKGTISWKQEWICPRPGETSAPGFWLKNEPQ